MNTPENPPATVHDLEAEALTADREIQRLSALLNSRTEELKRRQVAVTRRNKRIQSLEKEKAALLGRLEGIRFEATLLVRACMEGDPVSQLRIRASDIERHATTPADRR